MKVNITVLKAKLSSYLDAVRRGAKVTVLDRRTAIARLVPIDIDRGTLQIEAARLPPGAIDKVRGVRTTSAVDVLALLVEDRGVR